MEEELDCVSEDKVDDGRTYVIIALPVLAATALLLQVLWFSLQSLSAKTVAAKAAARRKMDACILKVGGVDVVDGLVVWLSW